MKTLRPRLTPPAPRIKTARAIRDKRYSPDKTVRSWYSSSRWLKLRDAVLLRDDYICQRTGVILSGDYPAPDSPVVDHIIPHRGDEKLFWDPANLQAVSKEYHDGVKRSLEQFGR